MPEIILNPENDADFVKIMTHGQDVILRKESIRAGVASAIKIGGTKEGKLSRFSMRESVHIEGPRGGKTSPLDAVRVNDAIGSIQLETLTSVYGLQLADKSKDYRRMTLLFLRRGYLDFNDFMLDGFYDGGRDGTFYLENGDLKFRSSREILLLDKQHDQVLEKILETAQKLLSNVHEPELKIKMLALYVSNVMGGSQLVKQPETNITKLSDQDIQMVQGLNGHNTVPIGYLSHGVCRHRAPLFKYLADRLGIRSRLVRGKHNTGHQWNVVQIQGKYYIVDVMQTPTELIEENSLAAQVYKREGIGGLHRGGFGGGSIEMVT